MRFKALILAAGLSFAGAHADDAWHGAGWYVMAYQYAVIIWSGPYVSQKACEAAKPANGDPPGFEYDCRYLDRDPG